MSSFSQQPPKTSESWRSSYRSQVPSQPETIGVRKPQNGHAHSSQIAHRLLQQNRPKADIGVCPLWVWTRSLVHNINRIWSAAPLTFAASLRQATNTFVQ